MKNINRKFSIDIKDILIIALLLFGIYKFFLKPEREVVTEKETTTIDIKKEIEEAINNRLQLQQPTQQPTIIYQDRVVPVYKDTPIPKGDEDLVKNLNKYRDTTQLENAKIYSEILSDGTVYQNKVTAEVDVKTITNTIEKKVVKYGSGFYLSPGVNLNPINGIQSIETSINYINKGDFGFGLGVQYDLLTKDVSYGVKIHKKIF
ncbi:hypothetical protein [Tenacibaculum sp. C7A-26P2]|uniref:hypothetical protein n=1 Tax=Tenacibaculum sp. C7A-26P2 TaxID=3447504 RepID=UPI003F84C054